MRRLFLLAAAIMCASIGACFPQSFLATTISADAAIIYRDCPTGIFPPCPNDPYDPSKADIRRLFTNVGSVTSVSVTSANGVSATVSGSTRAAILSFSLGAITPTSVAAGAGAPITSTGPGGALTATAYVVPGSGVTTALAAGVNTTNGVVTGGGAWTTYTPTASCNSGSLTSATVAGRYRFNGKTGFLQIVFTVTTVGSCSGAVNITLPSAGGTVGAGAAYPLSGFNATSSIGIPGPVVASGGAATILFPSAPLAAVYYINGTYEAS